LKLDVDKLREYNEAHGYSRGDALLKTIAKISTSAAQRPADFTARLGGEEFGVLLPDTDLEGALTVAENIRSAVEAARIADGDGRDPGSATVSIGAASWNPSNGGTTVDFIAKANENLDAAKNAGRNKIVGTGALRSAYGLAALRPNG
jgi:diguanylate cyclase (GGDEF)-like protein